MSGVLVRGAARASACLVGGSRKALVCGYGHPANTLHTSVSAYSWSGDNVWSRRGPRRGSLWPAAKHHNESSSSKTSALHTLAGERCSVWDIFKRYVLKSLGNLLYYPSIKVDLPVSHLHFLGINLELD